MAGDVDARLPGMDENCVLSNSDGRGRRCRPLGSQPASPTGLKLDDLRGVDVFAGANFFEQLRVRCGVEI